MYLSSLNGSLSYGASTKEDYIDFCERLHEPSDRGTKPDSRTGSVLPCALPLISIITAKLLL